MAKGGPRVYRPAKQPDGRNATRRLVPRPAQHVGDAAGRRGAAGATVRHGHRWHRRRRPGPPGGGARPGRDLDEALGDLQRLLLLNVGVVLVITIGLAGIALLVRRRTR